MARGAGRGGFSPRSGSADGAAGFARRDDRFSGRRDLPTQRCSARLAQRLQAAHVEDTGGRTGVDGPQGPRRAVPDRAVRALPAQRKGVCSGPVADVCRGRIDAQGERAMLLSHGLRLRSRRRVVVALSSMASLDTGSFIQLALPGMGCAGYSRTSSPKPQPYNECPITDILYSATKEAYSVWARFPTNKLFPSIASTSCNGPCPHRSALRASRATALLSGLRACLRCSAWRSALPPPRRRSDNPPATPRQSHPTAGRR